MPEPSPGQPPDGEPYATFSETHTSVVMVIGDRAYKVKKPVRLPFIDLSSPAARWENCRQEVELNQRLAPDVYLGVHVLRPADDPAADGEPVVVMRRMPWARKLATLLTRGDGVGLTDCIRAIAREVAAFHARQSPVSGYRLASTMTSLWREGRDQLRRFDDTVLPCAQVDEVLALALEFLTGREHLLDARERAGLVRDGHGDLLAEDIFCLDDGPRILDCLEFDRRLRLGDVLSDVAFLAMDLELRGAPELARLLMDTYRRLHGHTHPRSLEHHYIAYRAFVRAKIECLRGDQGDATAPARARADLDLCTLRLRTSRVHLVLVGGLPGSGKSTLAEAVAQADADRDWAVLSSDEVRKQLAGIDTLTPAPAPFGHGIYDPAHTKAAYAELLRRAAIALGNGVNVIIDASWTDAALRDEARSMGAAHRAEVTELRCDAPDDLCRRRLAARRGPQASDAGPQIRDRMAACRDAWPEATSMPTDGGLERPVSAVRALLGG